MYKPRAYLDVIGKECVECSRTGLECREKGATFACRLSGWFFSPSLPPRDVIHCGCYLAEPTSKYYHVTPIHYSTNTLFYHWIQRLSACVKIIIIIIYYNCLFLYISIDTAYIISIIILLHLYLCTDLHS